MQVMTKVVKTFPSARIVSVSGGLPVEVSLIAQLGHGSGDQLFESVVARQKAHEAFVDQLDEPSARLGGMDVAKGDPTSLYSFVVGAKGHPFHRHAGHRVFTAVSGSGGTQLRFSSASTEQIEKDPRSFIDALRYVDIPPDSLFTVRFGGETWHQFSPLLKNSAHPAFFALSCHTNELGGALPDHVREQVLANNATIPALTELLPEPVVTALGSESFDPDSVPTIALSLDAPAGSMHSAMCKTARGSAGRIRGAWSKWRGATGFFSDNAAAVTVHELEATPPGSLLLSQFAGEVFHHEDTFCLQVSASELGNKPASVLLAGLLEGFLDNRPAGVSRMMAFRNVLVRPLGLRTSPLGCPVSSLLTQKDCHLFAERYPIIEQATNTGDTRAQVILGADDKHLKFRSCVGVEVQENGRIALTLGTRVQCTNLFGRFYMAVIDHVHRSYITPTMLRMAADHMLAETARPPVTSTWKESAPVPAFPSAV